MLKQEKKNEVQYWFLLSNLAYAKTLLKVFSDKMLS